MRPSRMWLVAEIYGALIAIAFAWVGSGFWPFQNAYLFNALDRADLDNIWTISIGVPALFLLVASSREFIAHRWPSPNPMSRWNLVTLDESARYRGWAAFGLMFSWIYMFYAIAKISNRPSAVMPLALLGAIFMGLSWLENRRVQRDCKKQTGAYPAAGSR